MRYPRRTPSVLVAAVALALGAGMLIDLGPDRSARDVRPVDNHRPIDHTAIEEVALRELPSVALDLASSGLEAAGITLPELDITTLPPSGRTPVSDDGEVAQPAVGASVKHLVRDTPFKMVGFTWNKPVWGDPDDATLLLRAKEAGGRWGEWVELEPIQTAAAPSAKQPGGTEPVWVGDATEIQVAVAEEGLAIPALRSTRAAGTPAEGAGTDLLTQVLGAGAEILKNLAGTVMPELSATLLSPDSLLSFGSSMLTTLSGGPQVISRAAWGADESIRCSQPSISPTLNGAIVHHTAGSNDYTPQQSVEIVRGIYAYHARTLNWCDIGYNVLVDKYGQIFEGAFGGLDRNVEGTHTGGFNRNTVGVSMIGNLEEVTPSGAMLASVGRFLKWRLSKAGLNPAGTAHLTSEYFSDSKFPAGTQTQLPVIAGHRDYNNTSCPGAYGYPALTQIRSLAGAITPPVTTAPSPEPGAPTESTPAVPPTTTAPPVQMAQ
ncbi:peptidoglycan recognition protein family protein [Gordonia sp. NPDC003376]